MDRDRVCLFKCENYNEDKIEALVGEMFDTLEPDVDFAQKTVALKVNLLMARAPQRATTTHPAVVSAVAKSVIKRGGNALICDSPGGGMMFSTALLKNVYSVCQMDEAAQNSGAQLNFDVSSTKVSHERNGKKITFPVLNVLLNADYIINLPKLKTHSFTWFSGAVKNMFGAIPGVQKASYHMTKSKRADFSAMLVDLIECIPPQISIMDAVVGMEGNGPSNGNPRYLGYMLASKNPHALDMAATYMIGYAANEIDTLNEAISRGLCSKSLDELEMIGEDVFSVVIKDYAFPDSVVKRGGKGQKSDEHDELFPDVILDKCEGCMDCKISCPALAIEMADGKARIDMAKCIKCYCCQELCPYDAIKIG